MTDYIHQTDNVIDKGRGRIPVSWRNISGLNMSSPGELKALGWLPVEYRNGTYDSAMEVRSGPTGADAGDPVIENADTVAAAYAVRGKTAAEKTIDVRRERAKAYRDQLGAETGSEITTLGDVVDDVITQIETMRVELGAAAAADWTALLTKIAAIKTDNPKP